LGDADQQEPRAWPRIDRHGRRIGHQFDPGSPGSERRHLSGHADDAQSDPGSGRRLASAGSAAECRHRHTRIPATSCGISPRAGAGMLHRVYVRAVYRRPELPLLSHHINPASRPVPAGLGEQRRRLDQCNVADVGAGP